MRVVLYCTKYGRQSLLVARKWTIFFSHKVILPVHVSAMQTPSFWKRRHCGHMCEQWQPTNKRTILTKGHVRWLLHIWHAKHLILFWIITVLVIIIIIIVITQNILPTLIINRYPNVSLQNKWVSKSYPNSARDSNRSTYKEPCRSWCWPFSSAFIGSSVSGIWESDAAGL